MRVGPHSHDCVKCGAETPCCGELANNHDGEPWIICEEYHLINGGTNPEFSCERCWNESLDAEAWGRV